MNVPRNRSIAWLQVGAVLLFLLLLLPVLAATAFVSRFVLLGAALLALVGGGVLCAMSPRFREWLRVCSETEVQYKGLRLATDVAVSPVHSWARADRDGVVIGSDDLVPTVLGPVSTVELPTVGRWFQRGEPIAHLRRGNRSVALRAPVSGVVVSRNDALRWRPELVNDAPYTDGWIACMRSDGGRAERSWLQRGRHARAWFRNEIDRLLPALLGQQAVSPALADGGQLVAQVYRQIDDAAWQRLSATFFDGRPADGAQGGHGGAAQHGPSSEER